MDASTPEVTVNAAGGHITVTTDGTLAADAIASKEIKVNSNQLDNGGAIAIVHQCNAPVGVKTETIVTKVEAGAFTFSIRNIGSGTIADDAVIGYNFAVINRPA